jgi:hypothetical protein
MSQSEWPKRKKGSYFALQLTHKRAVIAIENGKARAWARREEREARAMEATIGD